MKKLVKQSVILLLALSVVTSCAVHRNQPATMECTQVKALNRVPISDTGAQYQEPCAETARRYDNNQPTAADFFLFAIFQATVEIFVHMFLHHR